MKADLQISVCVCVCVGGGGGGGLRIIFKDDFSYFSIKTYVVTPH